MRPEVVWFAHLCVERGLLTPEQCRALRQQLGDSTFMVPFARAALDKGFAEDAQALKAAAGEAWGLLEGGPPPSDPFADPDLPAESQESSAKPSPKKKAAAAPEPEAEPPATPKPVVPVPSAKPTLRLPRVAAAAPVPKPATPPVIPKPSTPPAIPKPAASLKPAVPKPGLAMPTARPAAKVTPVPAPAGEGADAVDDDTTEETAEAAAVPAPVITRVRVPVPATAPAASDDDDEIEAEDAGGVAPPPPPARRTLRLAGTPAPAAEPPPAAPTRATAVEGAATVAPAWVEGLRFDAGKVPPAVPDWKRVAGMSLNARQRAMFALLRHGQVQGASDLHLVAGARPFFRRQRRLEWIGDEPLDAETAEALNVALLSEHQAGIFAATGDLDYALQLDARSRFRVNLARHSRGIAGTYRIVSSEVPSLEELGFRNPDVVRRLLTHHNGLILITGPVGSGKTTTLAALVAELTRTRADHIITVEDPIEIVQQSGLGNLTQRQVGLHTQSFQSALKGALREDPDVIVIGELRDLATIEMAVSASETGHLVIGTLHTSDAATTLNRILDVFPASRQSQIRAMVAESLRGIVCQKLLPATDGGVALATEILLGNLAVANLIREAKTVGLQNILETGRKLGMVQMDQSVYDLFEEGRITAEVAASHIQNRQLRQKVMPAKPAAPAAAAGEGTGTAKRKGLFSRG